MAAQGPPALEPRRHRRRHRHRTARRHPPAPESPGGLGLSHGWMTKDQTVQFRNDIYDQDAQLLEATAEEAAFFNQAGNHPLTAHLAQSRIAPGTDKKRNAGERHDD